EAEVRQMSSLFEPDTEAVAPTAAEAQA
ncbi:hypothetical protein, partial [Salmonella enterica]